MISRKCRSLRASLSQLLLGFVRKGASAFPATTTFHIHSLVLVSILKGRYHLLRSKIEAIFDISRIFENLNLDPWCAVFCHSLIVTLLSIMYFKASVLK